MSECTPGEKRICREPRRIHLRIYRRIFRMGRWVHELYIPRKELDEILRMGFRRIYFRGRRIYPPRPGRSRIYRGRLILLWRFVERFRLRPCREYTFWLWRGAEWVQFLYTILYKCESPETRPSAWRHIEIRGIFESPARRLGEAMDRAEEVLVDYASHYGYDWLWMECYSEVTAGCEEINRFCVPEPRRYRFTIYLEIWNYKYDRNDFQDILPNIDVRWIRRPTIITTRFEREERHYHTTTHIEERKGVETESLKEGGERVEAFLRMVEAESRIAVTRRGREVKTLKRYFEEYTDGGYRSITEIMSKVNLGLDLDHPSTLKIYKTILNADRIGNYKVYETDNGIHLRFNIKTDINYRYGLGDCRGRIYYTWRRKKIHGKKIYLDDVLFHGKRKSGVWRWEREINIENLFSNPFWSKIPRGYWVKKRCVVKEKEGGIRQL